MSTASAANAGTETTRLPGEPILPEARMHIVLPTSPVDGKVVHSKLCTKSKSASFVRHVCVDVSGTPLEGSWLAGQSFGVVPPGTDGNGKPNKVRLYSIASPSYGEDGFGKVLSTTCKRLLSEREPQTAKDDPTEHRLFVGMCSNYVCDLREGDAIPVAGPAGKRFILPTDRITAWIYSGLSRGTFASPTPMAQWNPDPTVLAASTRASFSFRCLAMSFAQPSPKLSQASTSTPRAPKRLQSAISTAPVSEAGTMASL